MHEKVQRLARLGAGHVADDSAASLRPLFEPGVRSDHVEGAVMVPDGRGVDAAGASFTFQRKLAWAGQAMADLPPVNQIVLQLW